VPTPTQIPVWLLRLLRQIHGLSVEVTDDRSILLSAHGGRRQIFKVEYHPVLSGEKANLLLQEWKRTSEGRSRILLAVQRLAPHTRQLLRTAGLSWAEAETGICHLAAPGILIDVTVEDESEQSNSKIARAKLRDRSGLVAEVLLTSNRTAELRLAAVAARANASTGLVSRIFARLTNLKILRKEGAGPNRFWRLADAGALLDLWSREERQPEHRTNLYVWSRSPEALMEKLPELEKQNIRWAVAGVSAANLYAPTLTVTPAPIIWVDASLPVSEVASVLGGQVVDQGSNLEVWQSPGNLILFELKRWKPARENGVPLIQHALPIVSQPRAYIETFAGPGRAPEVAQNLRERMLTSND
jgi:AraC-like DNA-binding protein